MDHFHEHLRRLALYDDAFFRDLLGEASPSHPALDVREQALVRLAATMAVDGAPASLQRAVDHARAAGATNEQIVATLEVITPVTGSAQTVRCAPRLALALGYDVEEALESLDP